MFQFMGGDVVLMTAAEAKFPRRDLPKAARFMYLLPVGFYLVAIILVGLNINYLDPRLDHPHVSLCLVGSSQLDDLRSSFRSSTLGSLACLDSSMRVSYSLL